MKQGENHQYSVITLRSDIFSRNHIDDLKNTVKKAIEDGVTELALDFSNVETIDLIGFGVLRTVQKIAISNNVKMSLFGLNENVKKILLERTCLILDILDEEEESPFDNGVALIA